MDDDMVVIGIDSHKDILVRMCHRRGWQTDGLSGDCPNTAEGHDELADWVLATAAERVAIEGSGNYGRPAAQSAPQSRCGVWWRYPRR